MLREITEQRGFTGEIGQETGRQHEAAFFAPSDQVGIPSLGMVEASHIMERGSIVGHILHQKQLLAAVIEQEPLHELEVIPRPETIKKRVRDLQKELREYDKAWEKLQAEQAQEPEPTIAEDEKPVSVLAVEELTEELEADTFTVDEEPSFEELIALDKELEEEDVDFVADILESEIQRQETVFTQTESPSEFPVTTTQKSAAATAKTKRDPANWGAKKEAYVPPEADADEGLLAWQDQALCAQTDPEAFFPEKGGSTREAKRICVGCEVKQECLQYALMQDERFGIWGGLSERERRRLKRKAG
jgi:WhiB family redox-sensing transcriptional regulator